jgi:uncharacterized glyoxalase superfamily protein PhnB
MTQTIFPALRYRDAASAIEWLGRTFGFERHMVAEGPGGVIHHAELRLGDAMIMLGEDTNGEDGRLAFDHGPTWLYVVVEDPDAHHDRAKAAGAEIMQELRDEDYGSRDYTARDPAGNLWTFGTYQPWDSRS